MCYVKYDISLLENISYTFISKSQTAIYTYTIHVHHNFAIFFTSKVINIIFKCNNYRLTFIRLIASKYKNNKSNYNRKVEILFK